MNMNKLPISYTKYSKLPFKCKNTRRYKGVREPRCSGGSGCQMCWGLYLLEECRRNADKLLESF